MASIKGRKISVEARVDPRSLATIASALSQKNIPISSRSQLVSIIIETFCRSLVDSNVVPMVESTTEALQVLERVGIRFTEFSRRNLRSLALQIHSERAIDNLAKTEDLDEVLTPEVIDEALAKLQDSEVNSA